jgi:hypothetical protein
MTPSEPAASLLDRMALLVSRLQSGLAELQALIYELTTGRQVNPAPQEEYLSLKQLCDRIPYQPQTIRNLIVLGELHEGEHFLQRRRHGRIVFVWSRMQVWLAERERSSDAPQPFIAARHARPRKVR